MREIGKHGITFPETPEEAREWVPIISRVALERRVLVVAKTRIEGTWKAYCAPVPGENHDDEMEEVLRHGSTVYEKYARAMFPHFDGIPYAG